MPAETHVERSPIGPDEVFRMIRERLAEILEIDEDRITLDSDFADDLDADSLALDRAGRGARGGARRAHRRLHASTTRTSATCTPCATRSTTSIAPAWSAEHGGTST